MSTTETENQGCPLDPLVNKTVDFAYRGARLKFDLSHALFSSYDIDAGTRFLLKEIASDPGIMGAKRLLDEGCGTGIIGVSLAASCPEMDVVMRDRDFRAVAFSARNAARNGLGARLFGLDGEELSTCRTRNFAKVKCLTRVADPPVAEPGALGEPDPRGPYDAVVSNLPAKAGPKLLEHYFAFVRESLLNPGGTFAFVIVTPLAESARAWCSSAGFTVERTVSTKNHMVCVARAPLISAHLRFASEARAPDVSPGASAAKNWLSPYLRSHVTRTIANTNLAWEGVQGLPEFDKPSYATICALELSCKALAGLLVRRALVIEPGVGIAALWARDMLGPEEIVLHSHDTLALIAASHNLECGQSSTGPMKVVRSLEPPLPLKNAPAGDATTALSNLKPHSVDAIILSLEDIPRFDASSRYWLLAERTLKRGGVFIIAAESTAIDRAARQRPSGFSRIPHTERKKGWEAIAFRRD